MIFEYGEKEINYLKSKDKKLGAVIDEIGFITRELDGDLFSSVIHHIVGQQISMSAQATVWNRLIQLVDTVDSKSVCSADINALQKCGMTYRKAEYIKDFAIRVDTGDIVLDKLYEKTDEEIIKTLSSIKGIGVWTAEMIMTFCMARPDIVSFGDLAILRGMRMLYRHREITPELFNKYKKRYSPYGTVASLYLWAVSSGVIEGMSDPAPKKKGKK